MKEKIITYVILLGLVYGIFNFDIERKWSLEANWFSYITFAVFIAYLVHSLKEAAKKQDQNKN